MNNDNSSTTNQEIFAAKVKEEAYLHPLRQCFENGLQHLIIRLSFSDFDILFEGFRLLKTNFFIFLLLHRSLHLRSTLTFSK